MYIRRYFVHKRIVFRSILKKEAGCAAQILLQNVASCHNDSSRKYNLYSLYNKYLFSIKMKTPEVMYY